jgi:hypothetical protein
MPISNHGDLILYPVKNHKSLKSATLGKLHVLEASGTTGNRHEVVSKESAISHWTGGEKEYIRCDSPFIIQHVGGDCEHGVQNLEAGTYEVRHEVEYDPWKNELRRVLD